MKKLLVLLLPIALIIGCGDDSSSGGYSGLKTPTKITTENGKAIATSALTSAGAGNTANSADELDSSTLSKPFFKARAKASSISAREVVSNTETIDGSCGGTETTTINYDTDTGKLSSVIVDDNYCDSELNETTNGKITMNGTYNLETEAMSMSMSFTNFNYKSNTEAESFTINGSGSGDFNNDTASFTINATINDNILNKEFLLENFVFSSQEFASYSLEKLDGRIYQTETGYVDFVTVAPFKIDYSNGVDSIPSEGSVTITGAGGSQVLLTANGDQYTLTIDEDGDGTPESTESGDWTSLEMGFLFE